MSTQPDPLPAAKANTRPLGLALSGGGFRALLFHLGVLRYLQEHDLLRRVSFMTSVSGGSIIAAHLVQNWSDYLEDEGFTRRAAELVRLTRQDIRGRVFRRLFPAYLAPFLTRTTLVRFPPRLRRHTTARTMLLEWYLGRFFGGATLKDLRDESQNAPHLRILATNLNKGGQAAFSTQGFVPGAGEPPVEVPVRLAVAVATSAAAPQFFPPRLLDSEYFNISPRDLRDPDCFADGGVYDNLGLGPFLASSHPAAKACSTVLISDAAGSFDWVVGQRFAGILGTALRSADILMKRIADKQYEVIKHDPRFVPLRITDQPEGPSLPPDYPSNMGHVLGNIRTDLNAFTALEIRALVQHGYLVAASRLAGQLTSVPGARLQPWQPPLKKRARTPVADTPEALARSRRRSWGLASARDWVTWVHCLVLIALGYVYIDRREPARLFESFLDAKRRGGLLVEEAETYHLMDRLEPVVRKWPQRHRLQIAAAETARSALEHRRTALVKERASFTLAAVEREHALLSAALDNVESDFDGAPEDVQTRYFWLRGYQALQRGEDLRKTGDPARVRLALEQYRLATDYFRASGLPQYGDLKDIEYRIANVARLAYKADPNRSADSAENWLSMVRRHARRALELASYQDEIFWKAEFLLGAADLDQSLYTVLSEEQRRQLMESAARHLLVAHDQAVAVGEGSTVQSGLAGWLGRSGQELCHLPDFSSRFAPFCRMPVAAFRLVLSGLQVTVEYSGTAESPRLEWDFDADGIADGAGSSAVFVYEGPGRYEVSLKVSNTLGEDRHTKFFELTTAGGGSP